MAAWKFDVCTMDLFKGSLISFASGILIITHPVYRNEIRTIQLFEHSLFQVIIVFQAFEHQCLKLFQCPTPTPCRT